MGVQIPFSFPKSLDFKPLQTKVRILPWQMKSTRIIKISYHKNPRTAMFWGILPTCFFYYKSYILSADFAKYGKTVQFTPLIRSKIVVKIFGITTLDFAPPLEYF